MFIELENLFNGGITEIPLDFEFDFSKEEIDGVFPFTTPVKLQGKIENVAEIVSVKAMATFSMDVDCSRCAEELELDMEVPVEHILVTELQNDETDEYIIVEDMKLDIERLTLEDVYFALPSKVLCDDDCKGLCSKCGANLNEGPCSCKKDIDPRFEALLGLLDE